MQIFSKNIKRRKNESSKSYWQSYSDMMAALLLMFILVMASILLQSTKMYEEKLTEQNEAQAEIERQMQQLSEQEKMLQDQKNQMTEQQNQLSEQEKTMAQQQEQLDQIIGVKARIIEELSKAFENSNMTVTVDQETGSIILDSSILFDVGRSELKNEGQRFLDNFLPTYFNVLLSEEISPYISEIIIEGHTDTTGSYMTNLKLSQERALSVSSYIFDTYAAYMPEAEIERLRYMVTANGRSWNDLVYFDDGTENKDASRRVEFKFRLKDDEMIDAMMKILEKDD